MVWTSTEPCVGGMDRVCSEERPVDCRAVTARGDRGAGLSGTTRHRRAGRLTQEVADA